MSPTQGRFAPGAIEALYAKIAPAVNTEVFAGIVGDASHTFGYHLARNELPADDYSVQTSADRKGDGWAASALDVSLGPAEMKAVSARLLAACKSNDPRVKALREFFGTVDGTTVTGWDRATNGPTTSDDGHLKHVHLSFFRVYATDEEALAPIADVFCGRPIAPEPQEDDDFLYFTIATDGGAERGFITGPHGVAEVEPDEVRRAAAMVGRSVVQTAVANVAGGRPALSRVLM